MDSGGTTGGIGGDLRTDAIEAFSGATEIVLCGGGVVDVSGSEQEPDCCRCWMPASTQPDLASAACDGAHGRRRCRRRGRRLGGVAADLVFCLVSELRLRRVSELRAEDRSGGMGVTAGSFCEVIHLAVKKKLEIWSDVATSEWRIF